VIYADVSDRDLINSAGKSQNRAMTTLGSQLINWWTWKQDVIFLSITKVEYIADCEGSKDAVAMRHPTSEMQIPTTIAVLMIDSGGALNISKTSKF
jgi:hypothetical protein